MGVYVNIACPWCEEGVASPAPLEPGQALFACPECGRPITVTVEVQRGDCLDDE